jgi:hypothetical protein
MKHILPLLLALALGACNSDCADPPQCSAKITVPPDRPTVQSSPVGTAYTLPHGLGTEP